MELSVGVMLVVLGLLNISTFLNFRPSNWRWLAGTARHVHSHAHSHGDYVHTHPHGHAPDVHPRSCGSNAGSVARSALRPLAAIPLRASGRGWRLHGLAGSAAVTLLVVAAVREPAWAVAYLVVFGVGTIAGMMLVTVSIGSAIRLAGAGPRP